VEEEKEGAEKEGRSGKGRRVRRRTRGKGVKCPDVPLLVWVPQM